MGQHHCYIRTARKLPEGNGTFGAVAWEASLLHIAKLRNAWARTCDNGDIKRRQPGDLD
jgi:hypothetical protein